MESQFAYMTDEGLIQTRETLRGRLSHDANKARRLGTADVSYDLEQSMREAVEEIEQINIELAKRDINSDDPSPQAPIQTIINYYGTVHDNRGAGIVQSSGDGSIQVGGNLTDSTASTTNTHSAPAPTAPTGAIQPLPAASTASAIQALIDALTSAGEAAGTADEAQSDALQMIMLQARELRRKAQELQQKLNELPESTPSLAQLKDLGTRL